jgi:TolA-binding protein
MIENVTESGVGRTSDRCLRGGVLGSTFCLPMSVRLSLSCVSLGLCVLGGCATPSPSSSSSSDAGPGGLRRPQDASSTSEVLILRERITRLEKRLADVDARLGLLLARGETGSRPTGLRFDAPRGEQRAVDLGPEPGEPVRSFSSSIDLPRGSAEERESDVVVDDLDDASIVEVDSAPDLVDAAEPTVLRLRGTADPVARGPQRDGASWAAFPTAASLYEWGQSQLKAGQHEEALAAFREVLTRYARDSLADNALYWTAFCHQERGAHRQAIEVWQRLPRQFPRSDKIADALFGMARSHEALGEPALAETLYDELVNSYPRAEKLKEAKKALLRLRPSRSPVAP